MAYSEYTGGTHFPHFTASVDVGPPWLDSNDQQCRIDAQTGFLRFADIIKFVQIVLKLIPFIAAKQGYDTFYAMISEDFCDLLAPYFSEDDLTIFSHAIL